jgi:hypothetical protein
MFTSSPNHRAPMYSHLSDKEFTPPPPSPTPPHTHTPVYVFVIAVENRSHSCRVRQFGLAVKCPFFRGRGRGRGGRGEGEGQHPATGLPVFSGEGGHPATGLSNSEQKNTCQNVLAEENCVVQCLPSESTRQKGLSNSRQKELYKHWLAGCWGNLYPCNVCRV